MIASIFGFDLAAEILQVFLFWRMICLDLPGVVRHGKILTCGHGPFATTWILLFSVFQSPSSEEELPSGNIPTGHNFNRSTYIYIFYKNIALSLTWTGVLIVDHFLCDLGPSFAFFMQLDVIIWPNREPG